ncbi:LOW QUALITY PROTEIN: hypothetical protein TorRG33x02_186880 [Trema orientale]|uniref:Uncharacterized protein n=1 Tax=Trema orientale TaxID=63057 RepID=A0A2P5EJ18_TREOI|nr:LOW QUALITY PROTEIN: hypothetical protein TorRG33x02_186880 [Trema orientale]
MFSKCQVQKNCILKLGLRKYLQDYLFPKLQKFEFYKSKFISLQNSESIFIYMCYILMLQKGGKKRFRNTIQLGTRSQIRHYNSKHLLQVFEPEPAVLSLVFTTE